MANDCFISYASADLAHAEALNQLLTGAGFRVWFDKAHFRERDGAQWHREISAACEASRIVLPILTPRWKLSDWTRYESYGAEAVIPILAEGRWDEVGTPPLARWQSHVVSAALEPERLVASVRALLAEPAPEKRKRVAHLRYQPAAYFVGRERELDEIHEKLFRSPTAVLTQGRVTAVTALGGIGKTTLARQYAEKFWRCYREMYWVDCHVNLDSEFAIIHNILRPGTEFATLKDAEKAAWVRTELSQPERPLRLLILDRAENEEAVSAFIPKTGSVHTLITSRFTGWSSGIETCPVWLLEPEPARELLMRRSGRPDAGGADALAKKLDYLPLALEQAAAYVAEQEAGFGFAAYLRLYESFEADLLRHRTSGSTEYPDSVFLTWRTTIDKLEAGARALLRLVAFLAPTPIPLEMVLKGSAMIQAQAGEMGLESRDAAGEFVVRQWKSDLGRYSLIHAVGEDSFSVHALVQAVERHQVPMAEHPGMVERAAALLMAWAPTPSSEFRNWSAWRIAEPHAQQLWYAVREGRVLARLDPRLLNELGVYLRIVQGAYGAAGPLLERALQDRERVLGPKHPDTLESVNDLAALYESQGRYAEAEPLYQRALWDSERVLGPEHPSTLVSVNNLALLYSSQGRYAEAEPLYQRALQDSEQVLGPEHPGTLGPVNNLALLYERQGRYAEAEPLCQRVLRDTERVLGPDHPSTLVSVNNLANLYSSQGRYAEAEPLYQRALSDSERVLGPEHPDTLVSVNNLASLYSSQGRYAEAEPLYQRALRDSERVLGPDHPSTLGSVNNLALLYSSQRRYAEAEPLCQRAVRDSERVLGPEHPSTLVSVNNLALLYERQGRYAEAEPLYQRAAVGIERVLGSQHPNTKMAQDNWKRCRVRIAVADRVSKLFRLFKRLFRGKP